MDLGRNGLVEFFLGLAEGRYGMRVSDDEPELRFPPGFSVRSGGKLFVITPKDEENRKAMGMAMPGDAHYSGQPPATEPTPEMLDAGLSHLYRYHPEHGVSDEDTIKNIFAAMLAAKT
jgi:hypothetical protein